MARRRMIDPNFWESEDISKLSLLARLLFVGMISNADDEGKGRANPNYLKSIIFPYDNLRAADIDKALSEISHNTSVVLYNHSESRYYCFTNWSKWQRVDKPQKSLIPNPIPNNSENDSKNDSENDSVMIPDRFPPKRREENIREEKGKEENIAELEIGRERPTRSRFIKPSIENVKSYCDDRQNKVDPERFYDYYESKGWLVGKSPMKDWKACVRTWEGNGFNKNAPPGKKIRNYDE